MKKFIFKWFFFFFTSKKRNEIKFILVPNLGEILSKSQDISKNTLTDIKDKFQNKLKKIKFDFSEIENLKDP
jgi:ElaB/YqjD/DUF883 family membrane-anchored ribosome-binding protein